MGAMSSQITSLTIAYSTVYSSTDQRKRQSSVSLAFVRGKYKIIEDEINFAIDGVLNTFKRKNIKMKV